MQEQSNNAISVSKLKAYLNSLEDEEKEQKLIRIRDYKLECEEKEARPKKKKIEKIEREVTEEYDVMFDAKDEILELIDECKDIPSDIDKLKVTEYMLYRVDIRKAERIIQKIIKQLERRYEEIQEEIEDAICEFPALDEIDMISYKEFEVKGDNLAKSKEQYKLQLTEEERNRINPKRIKNT